MKVLIIGKNGQLARELVAEKPEHIDLVCLGRAEVDIFSEESLDKTLSELSPQVIINASAYTAVDKAESDEEAAYAINHLAVETIAKFSKKYGARLLHVSTDFVFDGSQNKAYQENDITNPCSVYGSSKLAGEQSIAAHYPENSVVVRTSWLYSSFGNNFVKTMLRLMQEKDELGIVSDQIGCPTYAKGLAQFLWQLSMTKEVSSMYHWSDNGVASWYDFAVAIQNIAVDAKLLTRKIALKPISTKSYPTPAKRPAFSLLNAEKSRTLLEGKHWVEQLQKCVQLISYTSK